MIGNREELANRIAETIDSQWALLSMLPSGERRQRLMGICLACQGPVFSGPSGGRIASDTSDLIQRAMRSGSQDLDPK